jgi:hypothetical protein
MAAAGAVIVLLLVGYAFFTPTPQVPVVTAKSSPSRSMVRTVEVEHHSSECPGVEWIFGEYESEKELDRNLRCLVHIRVLVGALELKGPQGMLTIDTQEFGKKWSNFDVRSVKKVTAESRARILLCPRGSTVKDWRCYHTIQVQVAAN